MSVKRILLLLLVLLTIPLWGLGEEPEEEEEWDWRSSWEEYGYFEFCDVQDDTLLIFEGVTALGIANTYYWDDALDEGWEIEPKFEDGPCFEYWLDGGDFRRVSLPSTLRYMGADAFVSYQFAAFTLPAQLEILENDAFIYCDFDVLRVETTLPIEDIRGSLCDCRVNAWEAPEDHPLYRTIDGVLFSKDGKTLLNYPNNRKDAHYDVPAGVERIADYAISNEFLKTISLPIGLKSIGNYAFSGCSWLQSIALPLTVQEIGKDIFSYCVSLELVSLPAGIEADRTEDGWWVEYYPDDALFRGDNGDTMSAPRNNEE